jgi:hypothetical protein
MATVEVSSNLAGSAVEDRVHRLQTSQTLRISKVVVHYDGSTTSIAYTMSVTVSKVGP